MTRTLSRPWEGCKQPIAVLIVAGQSFFRDLTTNRIRRGAFTNVQVLELARNDYVRVHNRDRKPFTWTKKASDILHVQSLLWQRIVDIRAWAFSWAASSPGPITFVMSTLSVSTGTSTARIRRWRSAIVEALVAPGSVNTLPPETFEAYHDHDDPKIRIHDDLAGAHSVFRRLTELGVEGQQISRELEEEGARKFSEVDRKDLEIS